METRKKQKNLWFCGYSSPPSRSVGGSNAYLRLDATRQAALAEEKTEAVVTAATVASTVDH